MVRSSICRLLVVLSLWLATSAIAHADTTTTWGGPYTVSITTGVATTARATLDQAVGEGRDGLIAGYGATPTVVRYVGTKPTTYTCHITTNSYDPGSGNGLIMRVRYGYDGDDDVDTTCFYDYGLAFVYATYQPYDIGKNRGGCDCDGGLGHDGGAAAGGLVHHDPVNVSTGNKFEQATDYTSPDTALLFRRFYNSKTADLGGSLGSMWRHSFDRSLRLLSATQIDAYRPDGRFARFNRQADGSWTPDSDIHDLLVELHDASGALSGFRYTLASEYVVETYSAAGSLNDITDPSGATTRLAYSDAATPVTVAPRKGLLLSVTAPSGRSIGFVYDSAGRLATLSLPDGGSIGYAYDTDDNLVKVTQADQTTFRYLYNEAADINGSAVPGLMTGKIDENNVRFETTTYSASGQVLTTTQPNGAGALSLSYLNGATTLKSSLGKVSQTSYVSSFGTYKSSGADAPCGAECNQPFQAMSYDANGSLSSTMDFNGVITSSTVAANGLLTRRVEASGLSDQRNTSMTWDTVHRVPLTQAVSNASGIVVSKQAWAYNARGQVTSECAIDPSVTVTYACGSQAHAPKGIRQTRYTYCDAVDATQCPQVSLLLTVDGPRTDVTDLTKYGYFLTTDESGCATVGGTCHRSGDLAQITDAAGHVTAILAYDHHGRPVRRKDANGVITDVTYTPRGWLASRTVRASTSGAASAGDATTTLTYDAVGSLKSVTDPDGVAATYTYDDAHRLVDVANALGEHIHYTLDASSNRVKEETFDAAGVSRRSLSRKYNTLGQLIGMTDGLGHVVFDASASGSYDANGNLVSSKDALGTVQQSTFDALDRLVSSVADANGASATTKATTSAFALDALDQVKAVTDPDGLVTTYSRDGLTNATGQVSPDTGTQSSTFDAAGNPLTQTDAKATVATQAFDALGRRTSASYADSKLNIAFHYDEANNVTGCVNSFPVGRLTRVVEAGVTTVYCYDNQGRMSEQRQTQGTVTDTTDYVYTKAGRLVAIASPSGLVTEYGRDALGRITTVTVTPAKGAASTVISAATYVPFGPVATYTLGNGQIVTRTYDANYQFTDVTSAALSLHVARDAMGNIVALGSAPGASPAIETYTYDPLYRLTGLKNASGAIVEAYSYSKTGDRLTKTAPGLATGAYGYQSGTHRVTSIGAGSRAYDANGSTTGNATAGTAWGYGYNGRGQLTVLQQGGATVATYAYDASVRRIAKTVGSATTRFAYGPGGLLGEYGGASRDYVWMDDAPVAVVDGTMVAFVHADGLNTPRAVTNAAGTVVWSWAYQGNPFGEQAPTSTSGYILNLRFAGQYWDRESGFLYNIHRYYDSSTGRYVQSDPIGLMGGASTYLYASGNPLQRTDLLGLTDLNLFPRSSAQYKSAQNFVSPPGTYVVGAHGNPINIEDQNGTPMYPAALAALIKSDPAYHSGETVLLLSCNTGVTPPAKWRQSGSFAQQLATALNANVQAPDHFGWLSSSGSFESRGALINGQPAAWDSLPVTPLPMTQDPNDSGTLIEVKP